MRRKTSAPQVAKIYGTDVASAHGAAKGRQAYASVAAASSLQTNFMFLLAKVSASSLNLRYLSPKGWEGSSCLKSHYSYLLRTFSEQTHVD